MKCTFCPPKNRKNETMDLESFEDINRQLSHYTKELAYHIVGDPLVLSNLDKYLDISKKHNLKVNITTTANNLKKEFFSKLLNDSLKQINFSLNSYNANSHKKSLDDYINPIFDFINYCLQNKQDFFINLRIWNLDNNKSAYEFNKKVFEKANSEFGSNIDIDEIYKNKPKNIRVARKVFFNFDDYFNWPSLENDIVSKKGFCYGLDSHFGVLASGDVVPCCLDQDAIINLGNIHKVGVSDILNSKRVKDIQNGFKNKVLVEELCQKCEYRTRFD